MVPIFRREASAPRLGIDPCSRGYGRSSLYSRLGLTRSAGLLAMLLVSVAMTLLGNLLLNTPLTVATVLALGIVLLTAAVCMLIAGLVAWGATRVRPLEVLRYE